MGQNLRTLHWLNRRVCIYLPGMAVAVVITYMLLSGNELTWTGNRPLPQDDSDLLSNIRKNYILPPPSSKVVFNPRIPPPYISKGGDADFVMTLFRNMTNGFYLECGANDGIFLSNTLPFEVYLGWTGILVEADPIPLQKLKQMQRNAWVVGACLSTTPVPSKVKMSRHDVNQGLSYIGDNRAGFHSFEVQCFPLFSILKAVGVTEIDYMSLDIEGAELAVLKTLPWEQVMIKTLSIEVHPSQVQPVKEYMTLIGYKYLKFIKSGCCTHDQIYAHPSILNELDLQFID